MIDRVSIDELPLKYGLNPHQKPARIYNGGKLPVTVESGRPGYINLMDALNGWQLVREMRRIAGRPAAASFKHVSPAGAAVAPDITSDDPGLAIAGHSPICEAYLRARDADPMSSFGDFIALSDTCDADTANVIKREVSDGIIAPAYTPEALAILKAKRSGTYCVLRIDPDYEPASIERRDIFGISFEQGRNDIAIDDSLLTNVVTARKDLPPSARSDLLLAMAILKYTQSNSVCYVKDGQAIGIGAGQQSRIHCTRLAGDKADRWWLRQHPKIQALPFKRTVSRPDRNNAIDIFLNPEPVDPADTTYAGLFTAAVPSQLTTSERAAWLSKLKGVSLGSDAFFPFSDNIDRARRSGVSYIAQPGGSKRDDDVIAACNRYNMVMCLTATRLFHH